MYRLVKNVRNNKFIGAVDILSLNFTLLWWLNILACVSKTKSALSQELIII